MNNIQDFLSAAASQLGVSEDKLEGATAGVLGLLKREADGGGDLIAALPGAAGLLSAAGDGGGGLLGKASKLFGGNIGQGLGLAGVLKEAGLDGDRSGPFLNLLVGFAKQHAGPALVQRVLQSMPQLAKLLG